MSANRIGPGAAAIRLAGVLAAAARSARTSPQSADGAHAPAPQPAKGVQSSAHPKQSGKSSRYRPDRFAGRAGTYYRMVWGVDSLGVKWGESGEVIRFTYRVLGADKAKVLNDKRLEPSLIDPPAGGKLVGPALGNVGWPRPRAKRRPPT